MKKHLLIAASAFLFAIGTANAQIVVRIGPPPPHPVEAPPPPPHEGTSGSPDTIDGTDISTSGFTERTAGHRILVPSGFLANGARNVAAMSGTPDSGGKCRQNDLFPVQNRHKMHSADRFLPRQPKSTVVLVVLSGTPVKQGVTNGIWNSEMV